MNNAIYYHSAEYAREHGELEQYRETSKACRICCRDIEDIISAWFDGMHLPHKAIVEALAIHGKELVGLVLSATVIYRNWDGRFSRSNKDWARTLQQLDRDDGSYNPCIVNTHPAVLNGFIDMYRREVA